MTGERPRNFELISNSARSSFALPETNLYRASCVGRALSISQVLLAERRRSVARKRDAPTICCNGKRALVRVFVYISCLVEDHNGPVADARNRVSPDDNRR
jgi:hypothetical protein